jgi:hypothetical protein
MTAIAILTLACSAPPAPAFFDAKPRPTPTANVGYADLFKRVEAGESLTVAAGTADAADVTIDAIPGEPPGLYRCYKGDRGTPVMVRITAPPAMPAPARVVYSSSPTCTGPNCPPVVRYTAPPATCTGPNCPQTAPYGGRFLFRLMVPAK